MPTSRSQLRGLSGSRVSMLTATTSKLPPPSLACSASGAGGARQAGREADRASAANLGGAKGRVMSNKMWGGRFTASPDTVMEEINASIDFDRHLYRQDIAASKAHAAMLGRQGIISADD